MKQGLSVLADNAAAEVADSDVRDHTVVRVVDDVIIGLIGLHQLLERRQREQPQPLAARMSPQV